MGETRSSETNPSRCPHPLVQLVRGWLRTVPGSGHVELDGTSGTAELAARHAPREGQAPSDSCEHDVRLLENERASALYARGQRVVGKHTGYEELLPHREFPIRPPLDRGDRHAGDYRLDSSSGEGPCAQRTPASRASPASQADAERPIIQPTSSAGVPEALGHQFQPIAVCTRKGEVRAPQTALRTRMRRRRAGHVRVETRRR